MNGLEVNEYITKATEALNDDPEHERWWQALYKSAGVCRMNMGIWAVILKVFSLRYGTIVLKKYQR